MAKPFVCEEAAIGAVDLDRPTARTSADQITAIGTKAIPVPADNSDVIPRTLATQASIRYLRALNPE
jgi:hypothetical protein